MSHPLVAYMSHGWFSLLNQVLCVKRMSNYESNEGKWNLWSFFINLFCFNFFFSSKFVLFIVSFSASFWKSALPPSGWVMSHLRVKRVKQVNRWLMWAKQRHTVRHAAPRRVPSLPVYPRVSNGVWRHKMPLDVPSATPSAKPSAAPSAERRVPSAERRAYPFTRVLHCQMPLEGAERCAERRAYPFTHTHTHTHTHTACLTAFGSTKHH